MPRCGKNIYKRKDGRWELRILEKFDACQKGQYKYIYAPTLKEVKEKAKNYLRCKDLHSSKKCIANQYSYWLSEWLSSKKITVKPSTFIRYKNLINNHISPALGEYNPEDITLSTVEHFIYEKRFFGKLDGSGALSLKTVADIIIILKSTVKYMISHGVIMHCDLSSLKTESQKKEMRVLTREEERCLCSVVLNKPDLYKLGVLICLYTGIRIGELCALKWKNISLNDKTLEIESTAQRLQCDKPERDKKTRVLIAEPKSYASKRQIPLPDFLFLRILMFRSDDDNYLLTGTHKFAEPRTMQNKFKHYLKEGNIENVNFHSLRHTFATRCVEAGFDIKTLSEILGHSSVKITLDKYVHSSFRLKKSNMDKLTLAGDM